MSAKATINKEVFVPHDEKMLAAVQVKRKTKKKIPFLATGGQGDYLTFICLSVTNKKPAHVTITKVKQFQGTSAFVKRSQWTIDQLRQVNGIDSNKDSPEFDLTFDNAFDQWVAGSAGEKSTFVQILHHTCQRYIPMRKPEFVNCQSKLLGEAQAVDSVFVRCKVFMNRVRKDLVARHSHLPRRGRHLCGYDRTLIEREVTPPPAVTVIGEYKLEGISTSSPKVICELCSLSGPFTVSRACR
ncbi:syntaxin-binding protein 6 isoform X2 [Syngnathus typhle]|uniref:syntaxin-binding protein 6 isoform X2 n=1 Tax=Syngnathus typhle TaxID=161592 RepID=UPI002A6B0150|nr:syntaxin-binding protein 6 isoform X2 [Syngnathus typhle]